MRIRAILFDLFDTLVDLEMGALPEVTIDGARVRSTHGILHGVLAQGTPIDFGHFARTLHEVDAERARLQREGREYPTLERFGELVRRLGIDDPELPARLTQAHMGQIARCARYQAAHPEILSGLRKRYVIGICSNFSHTPTAVQALEQGGLLPHLDAVVISEEAGWRKPRPEIFLEALRRLDVAPGESAHAGDRLDADVAGAAALGMRTVWLTRRVRDPEARLEAHAGLPPAAVIGDLAELPGLLEREFDGN